MRTYSVILVDDEKAIKNAIAGVLDWKELGFDIIATAESGKEALELVDEMKPDVVVTDIKTPYIDGLSLCKKLKRKGIKVVVFSAYKEFEYIKEAIYLGAEDYILKPVHPDELRKSFLKIKEILDKEAENKEKWTELVEYHRNNIPREKELFVKELLRGELLEARRIKEKSAECEDGLSAPCYVAAVFQIDGSGETKLTTSEKEELAFSLKQMIEEKVFEEFGTYSMVYLDMVAVVGLLKKKSSIKCVKHELSQICKSAGKEMGVRVTVGIGQVVEKITELSFSWRGALDAVTLRMFLETDETVCISDVYPETEKELVIDEQVVSKLLMDIKIGGKEQLKSDVKGLMLQFEHNKGALYKCRIMMMKIMVGLLNLAWTYGVDFDPLFGGRFDVYQKMQEFASLSEMEQWLYDMCLRFRDSIHRERKNSTKLLMDSAKQYIQENYGDSTLSVKMLCRHLNVSAAYFSTMFKRETGKSFVEYLTEVRMEKAKELLNNTDDKSYVVSAKVGYPEPNYFSYVFKKRYGIAPSKYRANIKQNSDI